MHVFVSDVLALVALLMLLLLLPLVEAVYPLWVTARIVVVVVPKADRKKTVFTRVERAGGGR